VKSIVISIICLVVLVGLAIKIHSFTNKNNTSTKPSFPFQQRNLASPITNKWFSSVQKSLPTTPLFAFPLAYQYTTEGFKISYPQVKATDDTVFASFDEEIQISLPEKIESLSILDAGDWHAKIGLQKEGKTFATTTIAQGLPYTYINTESQDIHIKTTGIITTERPDWLLLDVKDHPYLISWSSGGKLQKNADNFTLIGTNRIFIALLDTPDHIDLFKAVADEEITGTQAEYTLDNNMVKVTYHLSGPNRPLTLLPHQKNNLTEEAKKIGEYNSLRGRLELVNTNTFQIAIPVIVPNDTFVPVARNKEALIEATKKDVSEYLATSTPGSQNYGFSIWIGKGTNLLELSNMLGLETEKQQLLSLISQKLIENLNSAYHYDSVLHSMVANIPEFGNEKGNDHHFHYGYLIRAAAVVTRYDPTKLELLRPGVTQLVKDIANSDRTNEEFPYLRNFEVYESHSWADGFASFVDGNNQESTSEAINAWYGVYLWGKQVNDTELINTGLYLYNMEILGAKEYWWNIHNIYPYEYRHKIASLVWGGKADFTTWFGKNANYIYGIQILPITPASDYLFTLPNRFEYDSDYARSQGKKTDPWGELMAIFTSTNDLPSIFETTPYSIVLYSLSRER